MMIIHALPSKAFIYFFTICLVSFFINLTPANSATFERSYSIISTPLQDSATLFAPITTSSRQADALGSSTFNLSYGSGLTASAMNAFNMAANRWSTYLNDPVTINLEVDYQSLGSNILGQTSTSLLVHGYDTVRDMVSNNAGETNNAMENSLLPYLPDSNEFSANLPDGFSMNGYSLISRANYHALGGTGYEGTDGAITFSSGYNWDFDPSDGISAGTYDFVGVAMHEIGHALGFISEVDYVDLLLDAGSASSSIWPTTLDLFRFRTGDINSPDFDFTMTPRMLAPGDEQALYFGSDSALLSTGSYYGDGRQASHFKDNLGLGIMDPTAARGEVLSITNYDLAALDLIGWDVNAVPIPGAIWLFGTALIGIAGMRNRVKKRRF